MLTHKLSIIAPVLALDSTHLISSRERLAYGIAEVHFFGNIVYTL